MELSRIFVTAWKISPFFTRANTDSEDRVSTLILFREICASCSRSAEVDKSTKSISFASISRRMKERLLLVISPRLRNWLSASSKYSMLWSAHSEGFSREREGW